MMLQDQNYPDWGVAARRFWKRGSNRIVLFWYVLLEIDLRVAGVEARGCVHLGAIPASYYRRSISVLISLQSASAPLIRGNRWTRQGRGGRGAKLGPAADSPTQALTLEYLLNKHSEGPFTPPAVPALLLQTMLGGRQKGRNVSDASVEVNTWVSVSSQRAPPPRESIRPCLKCRQMSRPVGFSYRSPPIYRRQM